MEYEKKYKEALERAKANFESSKTMGFLEIADTIVDIFPELRESEDERTRKEIIGFIRSQIEDGNAVGWDRWIAYLEKQKELPFVKDVVLGYPGLYFYDGERMHFQGNPAMEENPYDFAMSQQEKNPKLADSIPSDCISDAKCENGWHKVADSFPDSVREVICKDAIGNFFIGRNYKGSNSWEISMYDDVDKSNEDNPPVVMWCDIPSEKQKEQQPVEDD